MDSDIDKSDPDNSTGSTTKSKPNNVGSSVSVDVLGSTTALSEAKSTPTKNKSKLKQKTLFDFKGFSGSEKPKNEFTSKKNKATICPHCGDIIGTKGSLFMHIKFKHRKDEAMKEKVTKDKDEGMSVPLPQMTLQPEQSEVQKPVNGPDEKDDCSSSTEKTGQENQEKLQVSKRIKSVTRKSRQSYTFMDKWNIISKYFEFLEHNGEASYRDLEEELGVPKSTLQRWINQKDEIKTKAADETLQALKKFRPSNMHDASFKILYNEFRNARTVGKKVSFLWLWKKGRKIACERKFPQFTRCATQAFIKKYKIRIRRVQRKKQLDKESYEPKLKEWHTNYREGLIKSGHMKPHFDEKWGRFMPSRRFNVDQVPLPFAVNSKTTYEDESVGRYEKVWVSQPGSGLEKRQCTLQLCFSPEDNHVKVEIIFRGGGKRISEHEQAAYHKDIMVFWQKNAWADTEVSVEWVKRTLKSGVEAARDGKNEFLLLCDNLVAQTSDDFKDAVKSINGIVWYGPPGSTDIWQPIDAGYGALLKRLVTQEQDEWLESDENLDKWVGNCQLSASDRRILITHWVGEANKKLQGENYAAFRKNCFEKTGCLMTADGSEDNKIKPEGLSNYTVIPPLRITGPDEETIEVPESADDPEDAIVYDDIISPDQSDLAANYMENENNDSDTAENYDLVIDRCYKDSLVGRKIRVSCEDGWHDGCIDYYNMRIAEYRIQFKDSTEDMFVKKCEIDGINVLLQ